LTRSEIAVNYSCDITAAKETTTEESSGSSTASEFPDSVDQSSAGAGRIPSAPRRPTCDDADAARLHSNELAHPQGWRGPTAGELWDQHTPILPDERDAFLASVAAQRLTARAASNFAADARLSGDATAAVDRRAIRDALLAHDLLRIHPRLPWRHRRRCCQCTRHAKVNGCQPLRPPRSAPVQLHRAIE